MSEILDDFTDERDQERSRHGCVSGCLWIGVILSALSMVLYLFGGDMMDAIMEMAGEESFPRALMYIGIISSVLNLFGYYLLLRYKKNGFYIILSLNILSGIASYFYQGDITSLAVAFVVPLILYAVLQIQNEGIPAWEHMD